MRSSRAGWVLLLAVGSAVVGPLAGIPAWWLADVELNAMKRGSVPLRDKMLLVFGRTIAVVTTLAWCFVAGLWISRNR